MHEHTHTDSNIKTDYMIKWRHGHAQTDSSQK